MNSELLKKLWEIRFQRVVNLEQESHFTYGEILRCYGPLIKNSVVEKNLKQIAHDEGEHVKIARKMLLMLYEKHG